MNNKQLAIYKTIQKIVFVGFLLFMSYSFAQDSIHVDTVLIDEVKVVDKKPEELFDNPLSKTTTAYFFKNLTEANVRSFGQGGYTTIALNGLLSQHTQVLWNGISVNNSLIGITDVSIYPIDANTKINLRPSIESYAFSGSQIGGAAIMEHVVDAKNGFDLQFQQGSFKQFGCQFNLNQYYKEKVKWQLYANYNAAQNDFAYNDYSTNPATIANLDNADNQKLQLFSALDWQLNNYSNIQFSALYAKLNRNLPASVLSPNNNARQNDDAIRLVGKWKQTKRKLKSELLAGYNFDQFEYEDRSGEQINVNSNYKTNRITLNETLKLIYSKHVIAFGFDAKTDIATGSNISARTLFNGGLFAIYKSFLFDNLFMLNAAIRPVFQSQSKADVAGGLTLEARIKRELPISFELAFDRNVKYPTINELYFKPAGNSELGKEQSFKISGAIKVADLLAKQEHIALQSNIEGYSIWLNDMIVWLPTNKIYWQPFNLTKVHSRGFKFHNTFSATFKSDYKIEFKQFYNFSVSTNEANLIQEQPLFPNDLTIGKQLPYVPKHSAKLNLSVEAKNAFISFNSLYNSERFITGSNSYFLQKYWLLNAELGYKLKLKADKHEVLFSFALLNLLDNKYYQDIANIPMPGRNYQLTLKYAFEK